MDNTFKNFLYLFLLPFVIILSFYFLLNSPNTTKESDFNFGSPYIEIEELIVKQNGLVYFSGSTNLPDQTLLDFVIENYYDEDIEGRVLVMDGKWIVESEMIPDPKSNKMKISLFFNTDKTPSDDLDFSLYTSREFLL